MRRRRIAIGVLVVLLALAGKVALTPVPHVRLRGDAVKGAYHVHSTYSDGRGTPAQIADAAASVGDDFVVLTDHNVLQPGIRAMQDGVLLIPATEESTAFGHVVSLGATRALDNHEKQSSPLAAIRALGGVPMLAHPMNRRMPWSDWDELPQARGFEVLSADDLWRDALHEPFTHGLIPGVLELPFNPRLAVTQIIRRPDAALAKFDALRAKQSLVLLCSVDAHGLPSYASVLGMMSMYLDGVPPLKSADDASAVLDALEQGHAYCALDAIAPAPGFSFTATAADRPTLSEGQEGAAEGRMLQVTLPPGIEGKMPAWVHYFRDGKELVKAPGSLQLAAPGPGDYRVEVWTRLPGAFWRGAKVPWILSNPIRLR